MELNYSTGLDIQDGVLCGIGSCLDKNLVIPEGVVKIKDEIFWENKDIESVVFPDSLKVIGSNAFRNCSNLKKVTFGKDSQLEIIKYVAFANTIIEEFISPSTLQVIERATFSGCSKLKVFSFPKSFKKLEDETFKGCSNLATIYIDDLGSYCNIEFEYNSNPLGFAYNVYVNGNLIKGTLAFPDEITKISKYAFDGLDIIDTISFSENSKLDTIDKFAFYRCKKLKNITLPKSLKKINDCAFLRCESLNKITLPDNLEYIGSEFLGYCYISELTIPKNTKMVIQRALMDCRGLTKVTLPSTITYDSYYKRPSHTFGIFFNNKEHHHNAEAVPHTIKHIVFTGDLGVSESAFGNCSSIETIEVVGKSDKIGEYAFHNITSLVSVKLPKTIKEIGHHAFLSCSSLKHIIFEGTKQEWENIKKDSSWFPYKNPYTIKCSDGDIVVNG